MTRKTKKTILIFGVIILGIFGFYELARMFSPGSFPFAEIYEFDYSEEKVIEAIRQFKVQHPEMTVPNVTIKNNGSFSLSESEGRKENSYWYLNYFYYTKENQIVFTWTRPSGRGKTSFAFVSLNNGLEIGHWKDINDDFGFWENRRLKKDFEERILEPIKKLLTN